MKSKLGNPEANTDFQDVGESIEVELETEDSDFNKSFNDDEESNKITFSKVKKGTKNPGNLIVGNKQQLLCNRVIKKEDRTGHFIILLESMEEEKVKTEKNNSFL